MTRAKGYSLWLMPTGDVYVRLAEIISHLSKEYNTPQFEPHITLIGEIEGSEQEIMSKTKQLLSATNQFPINLTQVDYLNQYFRCLFLRADETVGLMDANKRAREIFSRQYDPKFMPHLSLMYGDFTLELKEQIIRETGRNFNINFNVPSVHLFSTNGEPKDWYRVTEFPFK